MKNLNLIILLLLLSLTLFQCVNSSENQTTSIEDQRLAKRDCLLSLFNYYKMEVKEQVGSLESLDTVSYSFMTKDLESHAKFGVVSRILKDLSKDYNLNSPEEIKLYETKAKEMQDSLMTKSWEEILVIVPEKYLYYTEPPKAN